MRKSQGNSHSITLGGHRENTIGYVPKSKSSFLGGKMVTLNPENTYLWDDNV